MSPTPLPQPQSQPQPPPSSPFPLYTALSTTALAFITAQTQNEALPTRMNFSAMRHLCSPNFTHSWGHNHAVSVSPPLQGTLSFDGFVAHLQSMLPRLAAWRAEVKDVLVDEVALRVLLRISFCMTPKVGDGEEGETVENDMLWVFDLERLDEGGEGGVRVGIKKSVEFVDGVAAGRLRELIMKGKK